MSQGRRALRVLTLRVDTNMTGQLGGPRLIGTSAALRAVEEEIDAAAGCDAKVLITGETGVGKDVVARLIHQRSARRATPLATINCAGMPDTLLESELFGHVRGSFTGAYRDKAGLFETADRGTAFLDEAGEMSARMQTVLLRFLETGELQRVGSERAARRVNVRVVAATNRHLGELIASGGFREDLYYRLNVIRIHVPALREHPEDVAVIFTHFLEMFAREHGVTARRLTDEAVRELAAYPWPGNVRELKNLAERLAVKAPGDLVRSRDLPVDFHPVTDAAPFSNAQAAIRPAPETTGEMLRRMVGDGESFWTVVHAPFMSRDLSRDHLRAIVRAGLEQTQGNYRVLVELFNMQPGDYKRFLGFLRKHDCHIPFHAFRAVRVGRADRPADASRENRRLTPAGPRPAAPAGPLG
jgi:DNA-binding NtrC family response regulator